MRLFTRLVLAAGVFGFAGIAPAQGSSGAIALGSPEFRAAPERPFGWRGDGSGRFPGATPATEWSPTNNVRWLTAIGRSYSSPIITEKFVFVTSEPNLVICVNRADGIVRWKVAVTPAVLANLESRKFASDYRPPKDGAGLAAATPITDGQNIYALFANGVFCAVNMDGVRMWATCITAEPTTGYGRSASPIIAADKLIVHMSDLYAFDPATGKQLWKNAEAKSSYGTPAALKIGGVDLIVTPLGDVVRADDGNSVNSGIGRTAQSSPIYCGDGIICFGDSTVSTVRLNTAFKEEEVWNGTISGEAFGSPIWHSNLLFITTGAGELFVFDASSKGGQEPLGEGRALFENSGGASPVAYASLTLAGQYLFLNSNKGETVVLEATRQARLIHRNKLPDGSGSSPVFSGTEMFLRDGDKLFCIGK
jgi:outer membrane protein assembly factor BamB